MHELSIKQVSNEHIELHGHLVDTTDLSCLDVTLNRVQVIALDKLYSVTWIGLHRFLDLLWEVNRSITFSNIPYDLFSILCVFPKFQDFKVDNVKIIPIHKKGEGSRAVACTVKLKEIEKLARNYGTIGSLEDDLLVPGNLLDYLRHLPAEELRAIQPNFTSLWAKANSDQCMFWMNYFGFCSRIIQACILTTHATGILIEESLQKITVDATNLEAAIRAIDPSYSDKKARNLFKVLPFVRKLVNEAESYLNTAWKGYKDFSASFQIALVDAKYTQHRFIEQLQAFVNLGQHLQPVTQNIERLGSSLGERVLSFNNISSIGTDLLQKAEERKGTFDIATVQRKMKLSSSSDSWKSTVTDVQGIMSSINEDIERCVVALQGFDLVRQVLEHRLAEVVILQQDLRKSAIGQNFDWKDAKQCILQAAFNKLVTDQEKHVFRFFFDEFESEEEYRKQMSAQQGEIMLF